MSGEIDVDVENQVATLTIHNEEKRNALGPPILAKMTDAVDELETRDDVRCLVLTGAGEKAFSSGFDISYHQGNYSGGEDAPDTGEPEGDFEELIERVKYFDYPVIARINGGTFGGSMHLIAACDFRIAVEGARFGITPAKLGMIYGGEAIGEIMAHIGPADVKELLFTAEFIDSERAYDMGLLNDVVPREELDERTYGMAEKIASNAPLSLVGMKQIIRALMDKDSLTDAEEIWSKGLEEEAKDSRDHREGVEAFMENRDPQFEGH